MNCQQKLPGTAVANQLQEATEAVAQLLQEAVEAVEEHLQHTGNGK